MKQTFIRIIFWSALLALFSGCGAQKQTLTNHYVLEYYSHLERPELELNEPYPYTVRINSPVIPTIYDRRQIVIRHFGPRITYSDNDLWAVPLSEIIPRLVTTRLNRYRIFTLAQQDYLSSTPDYEINTDIRYVEAIRYENRMTAKLVLDFYLREAGNENYILRHSVNREESLVDNTLENFVQVVNDLILTETDEFSAKIISFLSGDDTYLQDENRTLSMEAVSDDSSGIDEGDGLLVLPSITKTDYEPDYLVYTGKNQLVTSARIGSSVKLPAGNYTIRYGSGAERQKITRHNVKVSPRYKTIVEPDWGCLSVEVRSDTREYMKTSYEIFDGSGVSYGSEIPANEELGEINRIWVLRPGLYKITINNEKYSSYRNFATVMVEKGEFSKLTIIVDQDLEGNPTDLIGAGILDESQMTVEYSNFNVESAFHGNFNFTSDNESDEETPIQTFLLNGQFETNISYDREPYHFVTRNRLELESFKNDDKDFRISYDELWSKNAFTYYFFNNIGLYTRVDAAGHVFRRNEYSDGNFVLIDRVGDTTEWYTDVRSLPVKDAVYPLIVKEGVGVNYRVFNHPKASMNIRAGIGRRQDRNSGFYYLEPGQTLDRNGLSYQIYREYDNFNQDGTELSVLGRFLLPLNISYTLDADVLLPFNKDYAMTLDVENRVNMKIFKYVSLDYKLRLKNIAREEEPDFLSKRHSLFLRLTYNLR